MPHHESRLDAFSFGENKRERLSTLGSTIVRPSTELGREGILQVKAVPVAAEARKTQSSST